MHRSLPSNDFLEAMGRTNDAILYGGLVQLVVSGNDGESKNLPKLYLHPIPKITGSHFLKSLSLFHMTFIKLIQCFCPCKSNNQ